MKVINTETFDEIRFSNISPYQALAYCVCERTNKLSFYHSLCQKGEDFRKHFDYKEASYGIILGDFWAKKA